MRQFKEYVDRDARAVNTFATAGVAAPYNAIAPNNGEIKGVDPIVSPIGDFR